MKLVFLSSGIGTTMGVPQSLFSAWIVFGVLAIGAPSSYGRTHFHKKKSTHRDDEGSFNSISMPPADSPAGLTVPSDPYIPSSDPCVFDVRTYGAVGDGSTDDTAAFQSAWKAACAVENGVLLVPSDSSFMIRSAIFTGPCQPGLVFQVIPVKT